MRKHLPKGVTKEPKFKIGVQIGFTIDELKKAVPHRDKLPNSIDPLPVTPAKKWNDYPSSSNINFIFYQINNFIFQIFSIRLRFFNKKS